MNDRIRRRVEALRSRTVERGCTPAEAETAKRLADELVAKHGGPPVAPPPVVDLFGDHVFNGDLFGFTIDWSKGPIGDLFSGGPFANPYSEMDRLLVRKPRPSMQDIEDGIRKLIDKMALPGAGFEVGVMQTKWEYWALTVSPWGTSLVYRRCCPGGPTWEESWIATRGDDIGLSSIQRRLDIMRSQTIISLGVAAG